MLSSWIGMRGKHKLRYTERSLCHQKCYQHVAWKFFYPELLNKSQLNWKKELTLNRRKNNLSVMNVQKLFQPFKIWIGTDIAMSNCTIVIFAHWKAILVNPFPARIYYRSTLTLFIRRKSHSYVRCALQNMVKMVIWQNM